MINDIEYITENEKTILEKSMKTQIEELEGFLKGEKIVKQSEIAIMKEVNTDGNK